jgi:hypothetical protein
VEAPAELRFGGEGGHRRDTRSPANASIPSRRASVATSTIPASQTTRSCRVRANASGRGADEQQPLPPAPPGAGRPRPPETAAPARRTPAARHGQ